MEQDALLPAIAWLAASGEPAVRRAVQLEFLGTPWSDGPVHNGRIVSSLLSGQRYDGTFGVHPVLEWLHSDQHRSQIRSRGGLTRRCASQQGNALYVSSRPGMATDPRVSTLARDLARRQWPDGGWNCDVEASGRRSSFHETLLPAAGTTPPAGAARSRA